MGINLETIGGSEENIIYKQSDWTEAQRFSISNTQQQSYSGGYYKIHKTAKLIFITLNVFKPTSTSNIQFATFNILNEWRDYVPAANYFPATSMTANSANGSNISGKFTLSVTNGVWKINGMIGGTDCIAEGRLLTPLLLKDV